MKIKAKLLPEMQETELPQATVHHMGFTLYAVTSEINVCDDVRFSLEGQNYSGCITSIDYDGKSRDYGVRIYHQKQEKAESSIIAFDDVVKIVGKISPDATWVHDGDKIEVKLYAYDKLEENYNPNLHPLNSFPIQDRIGTIVCKIKCPTCNTYH